MNATEKGGVERWLVKTGADPAASGIDVTNPVQTTIAELIAKPAPTTPPASTRLAPTERTCFQLVCTLVRCQIEADGDFHLVLCDASANTMVAEIPNPDCVDAGSPWLAAIRSCRQSFASTFNPVHEGWTAIHRQVTLTGVGFFDKIHGQAGVASNGVELHPVLSIVPVTP